MMPRPVETLFVHTAAIAVCVALLAFTRLDVLWAGRFAFFAVVATLNWYCLGAVLIGATSKPQRTSLVLGGVLGKLVCFTLLFVGAFTIGVELTSFVAAMNVFFLAALLRVLGELVAKRLGMAPRAGLTAGWLSSSERKTGHAA